mgnify:CR=1 FL=1
MSVFLAGGLLQSTPVIGTVPGRNAELDAAHACLTAGTQSFLAEFDWKPDESERWRWATRIVDGCSDKGNAAADSKQAVRVNGDLAHERGITKRQMMRSESLYYVDRLIHQHFEKQS